ncbi:response regulator [Chelativorans sp. AA-79]|uniref:response regulator n=1 Tax=Chelativorans sp. AA-79 TaxID=3028735 RepID=UPI0023FA27F6|nr:response regulator [Chelativorans sp. AA-79]WEX11540.1 response regulator [Chelativorans sp. AA-79]
MQPMAAKFVLWHEFDANRPVVLLAEDEPIIRFDIADELRRLGCQVIEASNADEAIDVVKSTARLDLVVTDVRMPGNRDGLDVARAVRQERPGLRTVIMSGHLAPNEEHGHLIDLFVSKPTQSDQLATAIMAMIEASPAKRDG